MKTLTYQEARSKIHDGDLISVFKAHSLFNRATQFFTGEYTHTGVAVWIEGGLWLAETNGGGNHAVPLSQLQKFGFDVSEPPSGVDVSKIKSVVLEELREKEPYGYLAAVATGFVEYFGIPITINWRKGRHCSGLVTRIWDRAGWAELSGFTHTYVISPTKLTRQVKFKFRVTPEILQD
jgi:hypothetical protein